MDFALKIGRLFIAYDAGGFIVGWTGRSTRLDAEVRVAS